MQSRKYFVCSAVFLGLVLGACRIESDPANAPEPRDDYVPPAPAEPFVPAPPEAQTRRVVILHTNDEHSHLLGFGPVSEYPFTPESDGTVDPIAMIGKLGTDERTVGGVARVQYLVNRIRQESADPVLLLSGGDVMMGTILHAATTEASLDYVTMTVLGYDFVALGNHEFDFGTEGLAAAIQIAHNLTFGGAVRILSSNIHFDDVEPGKGAALKALYGPGNSGAPIMPWATKVLDNGLKVGFLGLLGYNAALVAPGKTPITFSTPRNGATCDEGTPCGAGLSCIREHCVNPLDAAGHVAAMADEAQAVVDILRNEQQVDLVVAVTHVGITEETALAQLTDGIDVIVGGHSHSEVPPTVVDSTVGDGSTIIVQAGSYYTRLGQLVVTVDPDGTVGYVEDESTLHVIDHTMDAEIAASSDAVVTALTLTGGLIGPVAGGLNAAFGDIGIFDPVVYSKHDVVGERSNQDSNLAHLVTDAELATVLGGYCINPADQPVIATQANGVLRESLRFGKPEHGDEDGRLSATFDDVFRVVPLGASPYASQPMPGYPLVMFHLSAVELLAGADIGISEGVVRGSDSFFLSYAGMRVSYDLSRSPFNPLDPANSGYITKIELGNDANEYAWVLYDVAQDPAARWRDADENPINPQETYITVVTNLYLAGFLDAFGLAPRRADGSVHAGLWETVLCQTGNTPDCLPIVPERAVDYCTELNGGPPPWDIALPELKEWSTLLSYLTSLPEQTIPEDVYEGASPTSPRVVDATD